MFFWRRVAPQIPEDGLKPTATPGYTRNFRDLNDKVSQGKSFSGYERNGLFLNQTGNGFAEVSGLLGVDFDDDARAVAVADWDRDGDLDLWVTNRTAPQVRLLRNNQPRDSPSANSFVAIRLVGNGKTTNRDAIGARLTLSGHSKPQSKQIRTVHAGDGFLAQSTAWTHFGIGAARDELTLNVDWPGGGTETYTIKAGGRYTITQGKGPPILYPSQATPLVLSSVEFQLPRDSANRKPPQEIADTDVASNRSRFWVANRIPFPKLAYTDDENATRSTTDFLGKPVLVTLWATWCPSCIQEFGVFAKHAETLRSHGATILALNVDELELDARSVSGSAADKVLAQLGFDFPRGTARRDNLAKIEILIEHLSSRRSALSIPCSFLIDDTGNVAAVYLESASWEQLSDDLAMLNASPPEQLARASARPGRWFSNPRNVDRAAHLGDYATRYGQNGFPKEAQRLYELVKPQQGGTSAREYYNQAKSAAQQGEMERAMELYRAAIRLDPEYGQAYAGLGAMLLSRKRIDEAEPLFEKALTIDPNHATALINLAMIDQARGKKESALIRLKKVVDRNPGYAEAQMSLGTLLASMGKHSEAIQHLSKAVELNPRMAAAHLNLAAAYMEAEQWSKSENEYRLVEQLNPRMAAYSHFGRGNLHARQQQHAKAVNSYRKAISLGGGNAPTYNKLGMSLLALGEEEAAVAALKKTLELNPAHKGAKRILIKKGLIPK